MEHLVRHYGLLLALACLLEAPVYLLMLRRAARARHLLLLVLGMNLLTNPAVNLVYRLYDVSIPLLELAAILAEAGFLGIALRCSVWRALWASSAANVASWLLGVPLYFALIEWLGPAAS